MSASISLLLYVSPIKIQFQFIFHLVQWSSCIVRKKYIEDTHTEYLAVFHYDKSILSRLGDRNNNPHLMSLFLRYSFHFVNFFFDPVFACILIIIKTKFSGYTTAFYLEKKRRNFLLKIGEKLFVGEGLSRTNTFSQAVEFHCERNGIRVIVLPI